MDIGHLQFTTAVAVAKFCVVQANQVKHCGVEVVLVDGNFDGFESKCVGCAMRETGADAIIEQPYGAAIGVVIAFDRL